MSQINLKNLTILYDNVLVKPVEIKEKDGVLMADTYENQRKPELGEVVITGTGRIFETGEVVPLQVKKGDIVYFNKYSSVKFNIDGVDYFIVHEEDVIGYFRK